MLTDKDFDEAFLFRPLPLWTSSSLCYSTMCHGVGFGRIDIRLRAILGILRNSCGVSGTVDRARGHRNATTPLISRGFSRRTTRQDIFSRICTSFERFESPHHHINGVNGRVLPGWVNAHPIAVVPQESSFHPSLELLLFAWPIHALQCR